MIPIDCKIKNFPYACLFTFLVTIVIGNSKGGPVPPAEKLCSQKSWGKVVVWIGIVDLSIFHVFASILSH